MSDANSWNWKAKDGAGAGLLYEPGNWGDILKLLWLAAIAEWRNENIESVRHGDYFDPFAGDVDYPLSDATRKRIEQPKLRRLANLLEPFLALGVWPSTATMAGRLLKGPVTVWDAGETRRARWTESGVDVAGVTEDGTGGGAGIELLKTRLPTPGDVWLVDPYDFLADWRRFWPIIVKKSEAASILVYVFNRSAKSPEALRDYRAFRNAAADERTLPTPMGRVPADGFLPKAHHEMFYFPAQSECESKNFPELLGALEKATRRLDRAIARTAVFGV